MKRCFCCKKKIPRSRKNTYCKPCAREKVRASRERKEKNPELQEYLKRHEFKKILDTVRDALRRGHSTREQIQEFTGLSEDVVSNALAELNFNNREIRFVRDGEEARFYLIAA